MSQGRVEIKFITDTKELDQAKKSITDLGDNLTKTLDRSLDNKLNQTMSDLGKESEITAKKVDEVTTSVDKLESESSYLNNSGQGLSELGVEAEHTATKVDGVTDSVEELGNQDDLGGLPDDIEQVGVKAEKSTGGVKSLVSALGLLKVAGVAINMVTSSIDDAIGRVDTMRQFPKMMQQVGFTAQETEQSISRLSDGIQGLPTRLNDVVSTTQQIALINGDLNEATELTLALNNAFLASGSSSADASRGLQQFTQMLSSGTVDMQSWRTLLETMPLALQTVAENFGYAGASAKNDLFNALQDGVITFDEFSNALIEGSNAVGGFAELALTGSEGIATSFQNIRTAVVNGVSKVIEAVDELVEELTGKNIAQNFDRLKVAIGGSFSTIASGIRSSSPYIRSAITLFQRLSPLIIGVTTAYGAFRIITSVSGWFKTLNATIAVLNTTKATYLGVTKALTLAEVNATTAQKALALATGLYTGSITTATVATTLFNSAIAIMTGPIGMAAAALGVLVGGFALLKGTVGETPEVISEMTKEVDDAIGKTEELNSKIESSKSAFEEQITSIESNKKAWKEMADQLDILIGKEARSATDKQMIKGYVDELNSSMEGLNLTYDEETNKLNLSTDAIHRKIDAYTDFAKAEVAQERQIEIIKELAEAEIQLESNSRQLEKAQSDLDEAGFNLFGRNSELIESTEALEAENANLQSSIVGLQTEYEVVSGVVEQTMEAMATATEDSTGRQIIAFEQLSDEQQNVISELQDYYSGLKDHTQDMFNEINDTIMTTTDAGDEVAKSSEQIFAEMQATLEHNQQVVSTWADNMANLAQRGVDEGLLNELSRLGPEGAPYVQALVDASDEELATLSETFANGGEEALQALQDSLGLEDFEIDGLEGIITKAEESLTEQIESSGLNELGATIVENIGDGIAEADTGKMQESFETIIGKVPEWVEEGTEIVKPAGAKIVEDVSAGVSEAGTETMSTAVQTNVVDPVPAKIEESAETFTSAGTSIVDNIASGMENTEKISSAVESSISELPTKVDETVPEMESSGADLMTGAKQGVDSTKGNFIEAVGNSATEALDSFNANSGVQSPSVKYAQSAADIVAGAVQGINSNKNQLSNATRTMAVEAIKAFADGSKGANAAGVQLGAGFRDGLASMRGSIINTATSIANAATRAINRALDVRSPSRKGMYSGRMLTKGVEVGMEQELTSLDKMSKRVADTAIPKMAPIDMQSALDMPRFRTLDNSPMGATKKVEKDNSMADLLAKIADKDTYIVLDDGTLVGKMAPKLDKYMGSTAKDKSRYGG